MFFTRESVHTTLHRVTREVRQLYLQLLAANCTLCSRTVVTSWPTAASSKKELHFMRAPVFIQVRGALFQSVLLSWIQLLVVVLVLISKQLFDWLA